MFSGGRVVSIGITPWGIVDRRNELLGKKKEVAFHPVPQPRYLLYYLDYEYYYIEKKIRQKDQLFYDCIQR